MVWLPESGKSLIIRLAISTEYRRMTDGQTDGRMDTSFDSIVHALPGKNASI